jgi:hypothetical protein
MLCNDNMDVCIMCADADPQALTDGDDGDGSEMDPRMIVEGVTAHIIPTQRYQNGAG